MDQRQNLWRDALANFAGGQGKLETAIDGLPESGFDLSLSSDSWTIRQIIHHLADGLDLWKGFIKQAVGAPGGSFLLQWYWEISQDEWARSWAYDRRPVENSLELFRVCVGQVIQLIEHEPQAWNLRLIVQLPKREPQWISVGDVVEMQTRHISGHIEEICQIREVHGM